MASTAPKKHEEQVRPKNLALFNRRVGGQPADECWLWDGACTADGYGYIKQGILPTAKPQKALTIFVHRLAYFQAYGPIPDGQVIDHLCHDPAECDGGPNCHHRKCVNPDHLKAVPKGDNSRRSVRANEFRGMCRNGLHEWAGENIKVWGNGKTVCLECHREMMRRNYHLRKAVG